MLMTELEAANFVLRELGEQPISSLDDQLPTLDIVTPALTRTRRDLLAEGWWFNTFYGYKISPNSDSNIVVPDDTLTFVPDCPEYLWSGSYVRQSNGSLIFDTAVTGTRYADIEFTQLPYFAQEFVVTYAAAQVYTQDFGVDQKYQELMQRAKNARDQLGREHTRARRANVRDRPIVRRLYRDLYT